MDGSDKLMVVLPVPSRLDSIEPASLARLDRMVQGKRASRGGKAKGERAAPSRAITAELRARWEASGLPLKAVLADALPELDARARQGDVSATAELERIARRVYRYRPAGG
jgi:hypothetical protein